MTVDARAEEIALGTFPSIPLLDRARFYKHANILTEKQKTFLTLLDDWFRSRSNAVIVVSGSPGSGKTFTVNETLLHVDVPVLKMAYTAKIACRLGGSTIHSTLHLPWDEESVLSEIASDIRRLDDEEADYKSRCLALSHRLQDHLVCLTHPDIIVIDEIGMIPFWLTTELVHYFFAGSPYPKLVVLMGDEYQLRPVQCKYNIFNITTFPSRALHLTDNKRFTPHYQSVVQRLKELMRDADEDAFFAYVAQTFPVVESVYEDTLVRCHRVLVYTNDTAKKYNDFYLSHLPGPATEFPRIVEGVVDRRSFVTLKRHCDVLVTINCQVPNGTLLQFIEFNREDDVLVCRYPSTRILVRIARHKRLGNFPVTLGFATTIHKFQGETLDDPHVLIELDQCRDMHLIYTALSRVRSMRQILGIVF